MKRVFLVMIALLALKGTVWAQYDAQFSQYFMAMGYYNPAYAGTSGKLNFFGLHRQQWVGWTGAPKSFFVTGDMPLSVKKINLGIGAVLFTESIGLFNNSHFAAQIAYKHKLFGGTLSIGLQPGIANISFNGADIEIPTSDYHQKEDEAIPNVEVSGMGFDLNAGIYYTHKHFYVGIGAMHVMEPELELDENIYTYIGKSYNLTGGYNIQLRNPLYELQPSVFLKTDMQSFQADITARMVYNKMFNGGLSWRVNESLVFLLGATFGNIQVGYAYDFPINSAILKATSGSHEVLVRYQLKLDKTKSGMYKHKSVRIL
ncbi:MULTISPECIES: type IX secretion system membrane protein PorP/SprF [unclassified Parabacteroides]|uniref:PorP/SprF family type IX secretion system membrane protein n=1 Tax=unclassified Parabacteroides TaxID=2649774 RepID=UPI0024742661|nr:MULTISPECIES: type IX secretion system membrane protein PorP/SprF [unclassified Parabacteroides]